MVMTVDEPDERPEFLKRLFPRAKRNGTVVPLPPMPVDKGKPYATKALASELDDLARAPEGRRNDQLNESGFNLAQLVAGGYLAREVVWDALRDTAVAIGLTPSETEATLASAFKAGEAQPRYVPDLQLVPPVALPVLSDMAVEGTHTEGGPTSPEEAADMAASIEALFPLVDWHDLWDKDDEEEWILEPIIPARRLVALFSAPKVGKSLLMLELAVRISLGHTTLGQKVDRAFRVLYVDFENDPRGDIRSRLIAMNYGPHHLDNLCYLSFPSLAYLDTAMGGMQLLAVAQHYGVDLVVIDTISRAVQGEENDNDTWLGFYRNTGVRLKGAGIACVRLDHTGKDTSKGMRGGSAKYGDVDAVWQLTALDDTTLRLECTDNRLPIAEKVLTITRHSFPLKHTVSTTAARDAHLRKVAHALDWLRSLDPPWPKEGNGSGWDALKAAHGKTMAALNIAKAPAKDALAEYKGKPNPDYRLPEVDE